MQTEQVVIVLKLVVADTKVKIMLRKFIIISIYVIALFLSLYLSSLIEKSISKNAAISWLEHPYRQESKLSAYQVYNIAVSLQNDINNRKIKDHIDWQNKVAGYGGSSIYEYLHYNDNGKVTISNPKSDLTIGISDWKRMLDSKQALIKNSESSIFNFSNEDKTLRTH